MKTLKRGEPLQKSTHALKRDDTGRIEYTAEINQDMAEDFVRDQYAVLVEAQCVCGTRLQSASKWSAEDMHAAKAGYSKDMVDKLLVEMEHDHQQDERDCAITYLTHGGWGYDPTVKITSSNHLSGSAVDVNAAAFPAMSTKRGGIRFGEL